MIELQHLGKTYKAAGREIVALEDINLSVRDGEIYGIIGLSGAGKSTLVRCINLLERPTSGQVVIDGEDITGLPRRRLLELRRSIGMIFQDFNLLEQRSVLRNVTFPLEVSGVKHTRRSFPGDRSSVSPSHGRWRQSPNIFCVTKPLPHWIPTPPDPSWIS